jgi:phage recombination protein Bet
VTNQEILFFLHICRARRLNPFAKDCYLVKYSVEEGAAIITSIDFFRRRARGQKDCRGWKGGIIVQQPDGTVKDTAGLILEGETLVGAWFEAKPQGWDEPRRLEVNLRGYIKKTKGGETTRFWKEDNQPTMIAKVAESQGLRMLWPDEFQGLQTADEMQTPEPGDVIDLEKSLAPTWEELTKDKNLQGINIYISELAKVHNITDEQVKDDACRDFNTFWTVFERWRKLRAEKTRAEKNKKVEPPKKEPDVKAQPEKVEDDLDIGGECPEDGNQYARDICREKCDKYEGCPAWDKTE